MEGVIQRSFSINLRVMKACYLYPPLQHKCLYKMAAYLMHLCFVMLVPTLGILHLLLEDNLDMERVNYNAAFLAQTTCFTTKLLPFIRDGQRIRKCIDYFDSSLFTVTRQKQKTIIDNCIKVCRRNTFIFLVCAGGAVGSWATKPFFWEGHKLPVDVWLPFNTSEKLIIYYPVYFIIAIGPCFASVATGVIDPLIAGLAYNATTQIKILKDNLQYLSEYADEEMLKNRKTSSTEQISIIKNEIIYNKIRQSIDHHDAILNFVKEYEKCFSLVVFSQFAASVFSNTVADAIYMSKWYDYDAKCKKALIILMERSKVPIAVTAGK
ncbi:7tm 6 domain containing protein, partial [Asbolus verrucosus]